MLCEKCGSSNKPGAKFCESCGEPLAQKPISQSNLSSARAKSKPKPTIIAIIGVAVIVAIVALTLIFGGGGMSGRYVSERNADNYIQFKGGNNVTIGDYMMSCNGTYKLEGNMLTIDYTVSFMGYSDTVTDVYEVSEDKSELSENGTVIYRKGGA